MSDEQNIWRGRGCLLGQGPTCVVNKLMSLETNRGGHREGHRVIGRVIGTHVGRVSYMPPLNARQQQHVLLHIPKKGGDTEGVFRTDSKEKVHFIDTCCSILGIMYQYNVEQSH
jgi:hypothetical protein